ncbi:hypothetical protein MMC24_000597 [Lignoscripta atroalba]|nr:hypothetical protein [Lignoscripta atroalba]
MASLRFSDFSDSPTVLLPPQYHPFSQMSNHHSFQPFHSSGNYSSQWIPANSLAPITTNPSRKRCREDDNSAEQYDASSLSRPVVQPQQAAVYGEGMTLMDPTGGLLISAESQTGTWYEEQFGASRAAMLVAKAQGEAVSEPRQKIQRLSGSSAMPSVPTIASSTSSNLANVYLSSPGSNQISHLLGVGWTTFGADEHIQAAARGWARYIENHYPSMANVRILLKNEGMDMSLVQADAGYFLFSEDLSTGRFVASSEENCIKYLQANPIQLEGQDELRAIRTPEASIQNIGNDKSLSPSSDDTYSDPDTLPDMDLDSD